MHRSNLLLPRSPRLCGAILLAALWAGAVSPRADDQVLYPRGSGSASAAEAPAPHRAGSGLTYGLLAAVCAAGGVWFFLRNRATAGASGARSERRLGIAETRSLGNRQYLVVAEYDGRKFLLGVCPGRIDLLTPLGGANKTDQPSP